MTIHENILITYVYVLYTMGAATLLHVRCNENANKKKQVNLVKLLGIVSSSFAYRIISNISRVYISNK